MHKITYIVQSRELRQSPFQRMDAAAYLTNQGWKGDGHSLHYSGRGIKKPIHILQKANVLGVGKKQYDAQADQWWARAFDDTLKGLNTTKNERTGNSEGIALDTDAQAQRVVGVGRAKWFGQRGLYSNFVRGESLSGTLKPEESDYREMQLQPEEQWIRKSGSNDMDLTPAAAKDVKKSKRKRRHKGDVAECSKLAGVEAAQQDPKDDRTGVEYKKPGERPKDTETKEQRRQGKKKKRAREVSGFGESSELPEQPQATARNHHVPSRRPKKRSTEQLHTVKDADPVATSPCNASLDGKRKSSWKR